MLLVEGHTCQATRMARRFSLCKAPRIRRASWLESLIDHTSDLLFRMTTGPYLPSDRRPGRRETVAMLLFNVMGWQQTPKLPSRRTAAAASLTNSFVLDIA